MRRIKLAQYSLTGCEGCAIALIDAISSHPKLLDNLEIVTSRIIGYSKIEEADVALVDGAVVTKHDEELAKAIRKTSGIVVAVGSCAHIGGLSTLKDALGSSHLSIYGRWPLKIEHIERPKALSDVISVDYVLPGCPPDPEDIVLMLKLLLLGRKFRLPDKPLCFECRLFGTSECLLQRGELCLGPIVMSGCGARCPSYGSPCMGCRGLHDDADIPTFLRTIRELGFRVGDAIDVMILFLNRYLRSIEVRRKV